MSRVKAGTCAHTLNAGLACMSSEADACPVSHLNRSGFSWSSTSSMALSCAASILGTFFSAHMPTNRSISRKPRCLALYNSLLTCVITELVRAPAAQRQDMQQAVYPLDSAGMISVTASKTVERIREKGNIVCKEGPRHYSNLPMLVSSRQGLHLMRSSAVSCQRALTQM